ncbi:hypothetical protein ASPSYDRAFT_153665 [Aspergillus sydowii CBS 593.65]|uniref:AB hydrolase-1 domain-containing protein n=1 Tax=Aspergillus sydowii CBS 593.65 TaxID=1036612 RepID=A0A1L9TFQ5_9EURO|nr:uncharacterized protein ASPSYDRAFT_153665 [Aspergillus sydowii CBS 593.65]OJJ58266.1 hypothetical protein ASPSYDRAFT_153665 [Aspergillus sydowii CBS 593.65]
MSLPKPHITPDSFFHKTSPPACLTVSSPSCPTTIYFISGNPGLISYYHPFLSLLSKNLASVSFPGQDSFHIFAHSLAGFELEPAPSANTNIGTEKAKTKQPSGTSGDYYYNVEDQIRFVQARLEAHMAALRIEYGASAGASGTDPPSQRPRVILMGHSVGTYIAMEVLRRHRENQTTTTAAAAAGDSSFDIVGGIMLFPTVIDIASSPAGQKLTFLLRFIPQLALVVSLFARLLTSILPNYIIRAAVRSVMRSPPETAVDATTAFLKSKRGVRQALHMGADEMCTITTDKWSDDVWGVSTAKEGSLPQEQLLTRLFFYFGRNDHWVAEQTREEIIAGRGAVQNGPRMIVCEESLPHAFCLRHNETMANKVADMVQAILE